MEFVIIDTYKLRGGFMLSKEPAHLTRVASPRTLIGRPYPVKSVKTNEIVGAKLIKRAYNLSENIGFVVFLTTWENEAALIMSMEEFNKYQDPDHLKELPLVKDSDDENVTLLASWVD